jgi:spermidine/putrescine transport system substrate-binding protein
MTDWMAGRLISLNWLEKIDQENVPNCVANIRDALKGYPWDPNNDYHYPWQSGMTGIGYDSTSLKNAKLPAPTKIADLWTLPSDKVTFLTEARDTFGLALLKLGRPADPTTTTSDDLQAVHDDIAPLVAKGLRFTGNEYLQDFASKKTWAAMVWSGDLANSGSADQHFVFPEEGTMVWSDNMLIPKGAANKYTAELMMNWVYDPKVAAQIANYVYYVSPVKGVEAIVKQLNASSPIPAEKLPLLFPTTDIVAKQHNFESLAADLEKSLNSLYTDLSGA